jgi:hypothetical protein
VRGSTAAAANSARWRRAWASDWAAPRCGWRLCPRRSRSGRSSAAGAPIRSSRPIRSSPSSYGRGGRVGSQVRGRAVGRGGGALPAGALGRGGGDARVGPRPARLRVRRRRLLGGVRVRARGLRRRGRLCPVTGLLVHRGHRQAASDEGDGGRHHGPALVLLPAGPLATPCRPSLRGGRHGDEVVARIGPRVLAHGRRDGGPAGRGVRPVVVPGGRAVRGGGIPCGRCARPRRGGREGVPAGGDRGDVRGVGATPWTHQGAIEMPTAGGAVVHLGSSWVDAPSTLRAAARARSYVGSSGLQR